LVLFGFFAKPKTESNHMIWKKQKINQINDTLQFFCGLRFFGSIFLFYVQFGSVLNILTFNTVFSSTFLSCSSKLEIDSLLNINANKTKIIFDPISCLGLQVRVKFNWKGYAYIWLMDDSGGLQIHIWLLQV